tara:strand:- start:194 stop:436 length:243 start_codon:yes stop_codon:yes gene_type:complete
MKLDKMKTVGLRDMHPMQVYHLMEMVGMSLNLAAMTRDADILEETEAYCDELIKLFGGVGVSMLIDIDTGLNSNSSTSIH